MAPMATPYSIHRSAATAWVMRRRDALFAKYEQTNTAVATHPIQLSGKGVFGVITRNSTAAGLTCDVVAAMMCCEWETSTPPIYMGASVRAETSVRKGCSVRSDASAVTRLRLPQRWLSSDATSASRCERVPTPAPGSLRLRTGCGSGVGSSAPDLPGWAPAWRARSS